MAKKSIVILGNMGRAGVAEQIDALRGWFERRVKILGVQAANSPLGDAARSANLCVVFGGDGTLLAAARTLTGTGIPLLGVNMGKLGFLAEFDVQTMQKHFSAILAGKLAPTDRIMLQACVGDCDTHRFCSPAANDVAISAGPPFRMIDLNVAQGNEQIAQYFGDGLVISTPSGSTGYNLSAGGPILEPVLDALVITPIAPHSLSIRPIVVGAEAVIRVTATRVNAGSAVIIDGQVSSGLCSGDVVEVRRAAAPARIIPHPDRTFFDTLTSKLQWGRSPHHRT